MKKVFADMLKDVWPTVGALVLVAILCWIVWANTDSDGIQKWLHKPMSEVKIVDVVWLVIIFSILNRK